MADLKVLVTGASGFIAGHAIQELLAHGYAVRGTVRSLAEADVVHLRAFAQASGGSLELVEARLEADAGWAEAVKGCTYVWHMASPVPMQAPKNDDEVIRPAVDGTLRVLAAAAASDTVQRVIMTSSGDAIRFGQDPADQRMRTEADWSIPERSDAYTRSKLYAERAAWDFVQRQDGNRPVELVTINPGIVLGPLLHAERAPSLEVIRLLVTRSIPAVPRIGFCVTDVRDVATAHRLAMEHPEAAGNRYICAGEHLWMGEVADVLANKYGPRGYQIPKRSMPYWLVWTVARFDKTMQRVLRAVNVYAPLSSDKARREIGWSTRTARESILETAESMLRYGVVARSRSDIGVDSLEAAVSARR